jgi:hypothetical protein
MNLSTHVPPEELMAFLDGELSAKDAQGISSHIDDCAECSKLVEQLRATSLAFSAWKVPAVPTRLNESITESVARVESGIELRRPKLFIRTSFWTWKQYAVLSAGGALALMILAAIVTPMNNLKEHRAPAMLSGPRVTASIQKYEGPSSNRQSKAQGIVGGVAGGVPGGAMGGTLGGIGSASGIGSQRIATDPNGPKDASEYAFSMNGPPQTVDEQVKPTPMIARTVSLSIVAKDFAASRSTLDAILARYRGYSAQLDVRTAENAARTLQASLRIPAPALLSAVKDLKALGRVENESQSGEEVTRQHADLVARLKNSRDTEQRLREILEQRTGKVGEVLQVEQEIARVRGEIESMEAEQKALEHRVDFATVELQLTEEYKAELNPPAPSVSGRIHNAFVAGYHNAAETILSILLFFAESGPVLLIWLTILAAPIFLLWRRYRRIRALQA